MPQVLDGKLSSDASYDFYYKQDGGVRRLQAAPPASWGKLLRFPGLNLDGGRCAEPSGARFFFPADEGASRPHHPFRLLINITGSASALRDPGG